MENKRLFLSLLAPYRKKVLFAAGAMLAANLCALAFPWAIKLIIDEVAAKKDLILLNLLGLGLIAATLAKSYFGFMREYLSSGIGEKVVLDLRNRIYRHLQRLSVQYIENNPQGKIISGMIGDVESVKAFLFGGAVDFIYSFLNIFFVVAILLALDWKLALISVVYLPVFILTFVKLTPLLKQRHVLVREKYGELTSRLAETISGARVVAGFGREQSEAETFGYKQREILGAALSGHKLGIFLWMSAEFFSSLGLITLVWFGARQVVAGRITPGTLMAFYSYLGMLFYPVIRLAVINNYYQEASASIKRIQEILSTEPKIKEVERPIVLYKMKGSIRFCGVSFSYANAKQALFDISLEIKAGEVLALVGKSGAGKTTLANLLLRFYDPTEGQVLVDGHDLAQLSLSDYRSKIAVVIQDDYLFGDTIRKNIAYSKPGASEEQIIGAAKLALAHDFIVSLPGGYAAQIGERGVKLSSGQRQRISIARAILRDPVILILDEATSSVDSETERLIIQEAFDNLMRERTTLVIAHRLSAVTYADKIVFLADGKIAEVGTHFELLDKKGDYWKMWTSQQDYTLDGV